MYDPFSSWLRLMEAAAGMARTGMRASETMTASGDVVAKRSAIIGTAMTTPFSADHAEIGRMVPEKLEAFSQSGAAMIGEVYAMQMAWMAEAQHMGALAMRGRMPTMTELATLSSRNAAFAVRSIERTASLGATALAPIHAAATGNAKRLSRTGKKASKRR